MYSDAVDFVTNYRKRGFTRTATSSLLVQAGPKLALLLNPFVSWVEIGRGLARRPGSVAREVDRNGGRHRYLPIAAQRRTD